jgi:hypothetical protein
VARSREALQHLHGDEPMRGYMPGGWEGAPVDCRRFDDLRRIRDLIAVSAISMCG